MKSSSTAALILFLHLSSCSEEHASSTRQTSGTQQTNSGISSRPLTPEQFSDHINRSLGYRYGFPDSSGAFQDFTLANYNQPLGGLDFRHVHWRDTSPKIHTVLAVRDLAWNTAAYVIEKEIETSERKLFLKCTLESDIPDKARTAAQSFSDTSTESADGRWRAQLFDIYGRLYSRHPRAHEYEMLRTAFLEFYSVEPFAPSAWRATLFSLLATAEFWIP